MTEKKEHPASAPVPVAETTEEISDVLSQLETHKKTVVLVILGATLLLSGVIVFRGITSEKHLAAAQGYSQAASSRSIEELDQVVATFPNSVAAGNALLTKAELQVTSGKTEDARSTLLAFTEKYTSHPRHSQGLFAMGNLYQVGGDSDNANKYYDRVLKEYPKTDLAPFVMIRQGDLLLAAGKKDDARLKYEAIMPTYRGTPFFDRVEEKIKLLEIEKLPVVDEPKKVTTKTKAPAKPIAKAPAKTAPKANKPAVKKEAGKKAKPNPAKAKSPAAIKTSKKAPTVDPTKKKVAAPKKVMPPTSNKTDKKTPVPTPPVTEKKEAVKKADSVPAPAPPVEKKKEAIKKTDTPPAPTPPVTEKKEAVKKADSVLTPAPPVEKKKEAIKKTDTPPAPTPPVTEKKKAVKKADSVPTPAPPVEKKKEASKEADTAPAPEDNK